MIIYTSTNEIDSVQAKVRFDQERRTYVVTLRDLDSGNIVGTKCFLYQKDPEDSVFSQGHSRALAIAHAQAYTVPTPASTEGN